MKITSVNNELVKETAKLLKRKYREESGLFLLEGQKCIDEAISSGLEIERIFVLENTVYPYADVMETTESVLAKISSTETAPKAVAVAKMPARKWNEDYKKVVLLENIKDAGNLGTILRTATAFKIDAVVLYGDTVDLYNPKCVRSSVGNLWKIPVFKLDDLSRFEDYERVATLPKAENTVWLKDYMPNNKVLVMFGAEATGLSEELKQIATKNVTIEMSKDVESLNLSVSAAVFLYKIYSAELI